MGSELLGFFSTFIFWEVATDFLYHVFLEGYKCPSVHFNNVDESLSWSDIFPQFTPDKVHLSVFFFISTPCFLNDVYHHQSKVTTPSNAAGTILLQVKLNTSTLWSKVVRLTNVHLLKVKSPITILHILLFQYLKYILGAYVV